MGRYRILMVGKYPPTAGQVSTLNLWLSIGLHNLGHKVVFCSDALTSRKQTVLCCGILEVSEFLRKAAPGLQVEYADNLDEAIFFPFSDLSFLALLAKVHTIVIAHRPDVIFSHYLEPYSLIGHIVARQYGIPHVVTHAGSDVNRLCRNDSVLQIYKLVARSADIFVAKTALAARVFDEPLNGALRPYFPITTVFNPNRDLSSTYLPIRLKEWFMSFPNDEPTLLFYGKFTSGKCLLEILSAFSLFRQVSGSGRLLLIGGEVGAGFSFRDQIDNMAHNSSLLIHQFVPNWSLPAIIKKCTAVIYLKQGYLAANHVSIVPREVVACGTPLITTPEALSGSPSIDMSSVHVVNAVDPAHLASKMSHVVAAPRSVANSRTHDFYAAYVSSWEKCIVSAIEGR
jgi:hypothetical protein